MVRTRYELRVPRHNSCSYTFISIAAHSPILCFVSHGCSLVAPRHHTNIVDKIMRMHVKTKQQQKTSVLPYKWQWRNSNASKNTTALDMVKNNYWIMKKCDNYSIMCATVFVSSLHVRHIIPCRERFIGFAHEHSNWLATATTLLWPLTLNDSILNEVRFE